MCGQQIRHHALMGRVEMLYQDESHAVMDRQSVEKAFECIKTTGRSPHSDDR